MSENTFPVCSADAIVNFYRTEVLTGQEAKHFSKSDLVPIPKVTSVCCCCRCLRPNGRVTNGGAYNMYYIVYWTDSRTSERK